MIKILERNVSKDELKELLYSSLDYEDKQLYQQVNESQANIFQFSGNTASGMIQKAIPQNFNELTSLNALSRPGSSFEFDDFVSNGTESSKYPEFISKFLKDSHGCIIFQEQIMAISTECGINANLVRGLLKKLGKANPKQSDKDKWAEIVVQFKKAFKEKGMTDSEIEMVIDDFVTLSAYSFNKSHAAAYTYVACETLYMTRYFKPYFWAASLAYAASKTDKDEIKGAIKEAQKDGFKILPPNVNTSKLHFTPLSANEIGFGLNEIKGVGEEPAKAIIENGPYESIFDFIIKTMGTKVNKRITLALVGSGAFDSLIPEGERKKYLKITEKFYENKKTKKDVDALRKIWENAKEEFYLEGKTSPEEYMKMESDYLGGSFFHGIFSDDMKEKIEKLYALNKCFRNFEEIRQEDRPSAYVPLHVKDLQCWTQKNGKLMVFVTAEDMNGEEQRIPCFASYYEHIKEKLRTGFYLMKVYANDNGGILFGSRNWTSSPDTIRSFLIRWDIKK